MKPNESKNRRASNSEGSKLQSFSESIMTKVNALPQITELNYHALIERTFTLMRFRQEFVSTVSNDLSLFNSSGTISEGGSRRIYADHELTLLIEDFKELTILSSKVKATKRETQSNQLPIGAIGLYYYYTEKENINRKKAHILIEQWKPHTSGDKLFNACKEYSLLKNRTGFGKTSAKRVSEYFDLILPLLESNPEALKKATAEYSTLITRI